MPLIFFGAISLDLISFFTIFLTCITFLSPLCPLSQSCNTITHPSCFIFDLHSHRCSLTREGTFKSTLLKLASSQRYERILATKAAIISFNSDKFTFFTLWIQGVGSIKMSSWTQKHNNSWKWHTYRWTQSLKGCCHSTVVHRDFFGKR